MARRGKILNITSSKKLRFTRWELLTTKNKNRKSKTKRTLRYQANLSSMMKSKMALIASMKSRPTTALPLRNLKGKIKFSSTKTDQKRSLCTSLTKITT